VDTVEVLTLLRPPNHELLNLEDLATRFQIMTEITHTHTERLPLASVSFLGACSNILHDENGVEPSFETVLCITHNSGHMGYVYPALGYVGYGSYGCLRPLCLFVIH